MKNILLIILVLFGFQKCFTQYEFFLGGKFDSHIFTVLKPEIKGKFATDNKFYSQIPGNYGVESKLWYKERYGVNISVSNYEYMAGYFFDTPSLGVNGGGISLVFGTLFSLRTMYKIKLIEYYKKRKLFMVFSFGGDLGHHKGFDFAKYEIGSFIEYQDKGIRIDFFEKGNGQFHKNFFLLESTIGLEGEIFKWLTIGIEGGYSKGFKKLGEYEVQYKITNEPLQYAKTSIDGSRFYFGFRLGLRVFKSKPKSLKK